MRAFCPISQERDFSQVWDLCKNRANIIYFFIDQFQKKLMAKFSNKLKKPMFLAHFGSIFPIYGAKESFSGKSDSVTHNFIRVSCTMPKVRKS